MRDRSLDDVLKELGQMNNEYVAAEFRLSEARRAECAATNARNDAGKRLNRVREELLAALPKEVAC